MGTCTPCLHTSRPWLKVLDVRFYGSRWRARGDRFPRATPRRLLRSLYIGERGARARALGCLSSCFHSRFASQFGDDSCLCWRSALSALVSGIVSDLVSALLSAAVLLLSLPALSSRLCFSSLLSHLCLGYASRSSRSPLQYSIPSEDYGIQRKTFLKNFLQSSSIVFQKVAFQIYFPMT